MTITASMEQIEFYWMYGEVSEKNVLPYFHAPKNDNELLLNYQYEIIMHHSKAAEEKLWVKSISLAGAFIRKEMKKKGFFLSREEIEDKKLDAVEYVLRRFKGTKQYYIKESFTSAIYFGVEHALYYRSKSESLIDEIVEKMNRNKSLTFEDCLENVKEKRYAKKEKKALQLTFEF